MEKNFVKELTWRGMVHDVTPGTEEQLLKEITTGYVGIDPTADSLHIGHLVSVMMLKHLQLAGHKPILLIGGATGMIGDPSFKSEERNLLSEETINRNIEGIRKQLGKFLDYNNSESGAEILNNYEWMKNMSFLHFIRDVGKHITINYMLSKDSVQKRLETGLSFTEFSYQLIQGFDFYHLFQNKQCKLQMGGSDQWGNILTGTELIRRKSGGEAFALTCPLITKADGSKFGKTESGNVWLDPEKTSPYKFYQFWLNVSDEDASRYIKIFTLLNKDEIEQLEKEHQEAPHMRALQKRLAMEVTIMVHSKEELEKAVEASEILFGKGTTETLKNLSEDDLLSVFEGVPQMELNKEELEQGINVVEFLSDKTQIFPSRGEARKMIQGGGIAINKSKIDSPESVVSTADLLNQKYILTQKGKKNYYLIKVV
jgi:tyrosyl-tRNA synthetase